MSSSPRFAPARKSTTTRRFGSTRMARRLSISLTVSPIRNEHGEIVGASKVARDITERSRLLAAAREHAANTEKLGEVGAVVASTLDREAIVQKVTDIATELTHARVRRLLLQRDRSRVRRCVHAVHAVGRPARSVREVSASSRDGDVCPDVPRRRAGPARRRHRGSALRTRAPRISGCRRDTCRSGVTWRCR